jgi:hypothetical protein
VQHWRAELHAPLQQSLPPSQGVPRLWQQLLVPELHTPEQQSASNTGLQALPLGRQAPQEGPWYWMHERAPQHSEPEQPVPPPAQQTSPTQLPLMQSGPLTHGWPLARCAAGWHLPSAWLQYRPPQHCALSLQVSPSGAQAQKPPRQRRFEQQSSSPSHDRPEPTQPLRQ